MKIEVGMYVRTKLGIGKVITVTEYNVGIEFSQFNTMVLPICDTNIKKASYNIIDLIEVGDVLKVIHDNEEFICKVVKMCGTKGVRINTNYDVSLGAFDIKEILTKEQFEANSYKVGE